MKNLLLLVYATTLTFFVATASANPINYFREDGHTNWQYVANFSSAILILLLSSTAISLFFSHRRAQKANRALKEIRDALEQRVLERTATLDESNQLLQQTNTLLEDEVSQHKNTSERLLASETYIKNILESMPSMLIGLDSKMNITQWNSCAEEITGISNEKVYGKKLWEAYPTITVTQDQVEKVLTEQKPATIKYSQRGQYYFDITIYPLKGQLEAGVVILIDNVTQRTIAENQLIQRDKMSSMGELASTMAHDIDMPLQAIFKDLNSIQRSLTDSNPDVQATLLDATERANQASQIIRNLLDFSQISERKKRLASIPEIVEHSLELARNTLSDPSGLRFQDINIEKHYEENLPKLPCYKSELQQVFLSLFRHACHALGNTQKDNHNPNIKIEILTCYDAFWIKIQHNGLGLTAEEQHEIFEPYFHDSLNKKAAETENRLSFSQFIIVEHHQGQIAVTSDVDIGTTFHIQFQLI